MRSFRSTLPTELLAAEATPVILPKISDRHRLCQLETADAVPLFSIIEGSRTSLRQWLPWLDATRSAGDVLSFIERTQREWDNGEAFHLGIFYDERIVGVIGHHRIDWASRAGALGYWLAETDRGKGLMTASCRTVVRHAFEVLGLHRIEIRCAVDNGRSRAIPERLGFTLEGVRRDAEWLYDRHVDLAIYGLLRREFEPVVI